MNIWVCPYCGSKTKMVKGSVIYPYRRDLHEKHFFLCAPCNAYVGCHPGTTNPLGRLANAELRKAKSDAHAAFDPVWREGGMKRQQAYRWLAEQLGISREECHIGLMDVELCRQVVEICKTCP